MFDKMHDILEESWAYQEMIRKGRQQGYQQGFQQATIDVIIARFPDLETLARAKITAIDDLERLKQVIVDLALSRTREQMEYVLLSLDA